MQVPAGKSKTLVLDVLGYVLFVVGAFLALATESVADKIPLVRDLEMLPQIIVGAAVALVGIALLVISDRLKRNHSKQHVDKGTTGASS